MIAFLQLGKTPRLFTVFADFYISVTICRLYRKLEIGERGKEAWCPCQFYSILYYIIVS